MDIDWSKAPDGATHYDLRAGVFCNEEGFWTTCKYMPLKTHEEILNFPQFSKRPKLNSDKFDELPVIGCECEILGAPNGDWSVGVIDYIDERHCVWHWKLSPNDTMHNRVSKMQFRPIRTKDQKEIEELLKVMKPPGGWPFLMINDMEEAARSIIAAGYRKPEND